MHEAVPPHYQRPSFCAPPRGPEVHVGTVRLRRQANDAIARRMIRHALSLVVRSPRVRLLHAPAARHRRDAGPGPARRACGSQHPHLHSHTP